MHDAIFSQMDFGPLNEFLENDDITDISYSNGGQVWLKTLTKGVYQVERPDINDPFMEKLAFQCSNVMGTTFNMAHPFLDAESAELRMNFVHDSIATNGIACVVRKTPAKIRLNKEKLLNEKYITEELHDFLIKCVEGRCNIIVCGETGSGKTELVKYLASHTKENEKIITIEDTLELHLDRIFPHRDIVAMKTNNIASYSDVLVTCMRQNPIWILLSEVRSAEAVMAVRNSISSGHHILSTIHADKASSIPMRMYSLLESSQEIEQFLSSIHRYIQLGIYVKGYFSKELNRFQREIIEICEFYVDDDNVARSNNIYRKTMDGQFTLNNPTKRLIDYLNIGNVFLPEDVFNLNGENSEPRETSGASFDDVLNGDDGNEPVEEVADNSIDTGLGQPVGETQEVSQVAEPSNIQMDTMTETSDEVSEGEQPEVVQPTNVVVEQTKPLAVEVSATNTENVVNETTLNSSVGSAPAIDINTIVTSTPTPISINNDTEIETL